MIVELVVGVAGSGKTTYCRGLSEKYPILHDEWVDEQYGEYAVQQDLRKIFRMWLGTRCVTKQLVKDALRENPLFNVLLRNYFTIRFALMIKDRIDIGKKHLAFVIECPFLDENIEALKELYPNELMITKVTAPTEVIKKRLISRGWSDARIALSHDYQVTELSRFQHLVDKVVINGQGEL